MSGRFEGMSGAERELFKNIFHEKARNACCVSAQDFEFAAVYCNDVPLVRSFERRSMGIKKAQAAAG